VAETSFALVDSPFFLKGGKRNVRTQFVWVKPVARLLIGVHFSLNRNAYTSRVHFANVSEDEALLP
jgi:hypothetical protein